MKRQHFRDLQSSLLRFGFILHETFVDDSTIIWFAANAIESDVSAYLRIVYKQRLQVLAVYLGWRHAASHSFCLDAIRTDWPAGFDWLQGVGVLKAPCLSLFNLAEYMSWPLNGISIKDAKSLSESIETGLGQVISNVSNEGWLQVNIRSLFELYVKDKEPFGWRNSNAAIRLAQIAGLSKELGLGCKSFDKCAAEHLKLIEADMFSFGSASSWRDSLRLRIKN